MGFLYNARDFWRRKGPRTWVDKIIVYPSLALMLLAVPACAVALATDPDFSDTPKITYINQTDHVVNLYVDGFHQATLSPGEQYTDDYFYWRGDQRLFEAVDRDGEIVFAVNLTRDDLEDMDWRLQITETYAQ